MEALRKVLLSHLRESNSTVLFLKRISITTTLGGIDMVMYMTMLMCLVLAEQICYAAAAAEQVPRLATANISTTCCCEHVRNTAAAQITYMK